MWINNILHDVLEKEIHHKNYQCNDQGSVQDSHSIVRQFGIRRPSYFMNKFIVRFLKICNYFLHRNKICTGGETRTPDPRFWRPVLYQTELLPCNKSVPNGTDYIIFSQKSLLSDLHLPYGHLHE